MGNIDDRIQSVKVALSHDLKGPLSSINLYAQLAMRSPSADDALLGHLATIRMLTARSAAMLDGLAKWLAIEPLDSPDSVDVERCVRAAVDAELSTSEVVVTLDLPHAVQGDAGQITALFGHLLQNVVVHTEASKVTVTSDRVDGFVEVVVSDNGCGLPAGDHDRLLELYALPAGSSSRAGVGLALASRYAHVNGGTLKLHSRGEGCQVAVRLRAVETTRSSVGAGAGQTGAD